MHERSILFAVVAGLTITTPLAASAQWLPPYAPPPVWGGVAFHGYGGAWMGWPCGAYGCGLGSDYRIQLRRELRFQELRARNPSAGHPAFPLPQRDLPPPTPEGDIQPEYRDASQIRPEFRRAGDALSQGGER